jgi:hypothetical protein
MKTAAVVFLILLCATACSRVVIDPRWQAPITTTMEVDKLSGARLFELSKSWLSSNLYPEQRVIEYENKADGVLVANGVMDYPATGFDAIARIQYTISFQVRVKTAAGEISLTFENFMIYVPKVYDRRAERWVGREYFGGYSRPPVDAEEYAAARKGVLAIAEKLWRFIEQKNGLPEKGDR